VVGRPRTRHPNGLGIVHMMARATQLSNLQENQCKITKKNLCERIKLILSSRVSK